MKTGKAQLTVVRGWVNKEALDHDSHGQVNLAYLSEVERGWKQNASQCCFQDR